MLKLFWAPTLKLNLPPYGKFTKFHDFSSKYTISCQNSQIHCYVTCTHLLVSLCYFLKLLKPLVERSSVHPPTFIIIYPREETIICNNWFPCWLDVLPLKHHHRGKILTCRWIRCHHGCIFAIISMGYLSNNEGSGGSLWINTYFFVPQTNNLLRKVIYKKKTIYAHNGKVEMEKF